MGIISFFIEALLMILNTLTSVYTLIVVGACLVSWVQADPYNPIVRVLRTLTEPLLWRIRKYLPFTYGRGIDFSPVVLLLGVQIVSLGFQKFLLWLLLAAR